MGVGREREREREREEDKKEKLELFVDDTVISREDIPLEQIVLQVCQYKLNLQN